MDLHRRIFRKNYVIISPHTVSEESVDRVSFKAHSNLNDQSDAMCLTGRFTVALRILKIILSKRVQIAPSTSAIINGGS